MKKHFHLEASTLRQAGNCGQVIISLVKAIKREKRLAYL